MVRNPISAVAAPKVLPNGRATQFQATRPPISRGLATALLLCAAFFWGAGNVASKTVVEHVGPLSAVALRCLIALLVISPFALREMRLQRGWDGWVSATWVSLLFAAALSVQQAAFLTTSVTNVSFLVNTCTILTPVIAWIVLRERPALRILMAATITLGGAFLMAGGSLSLADLNQGDLLCIVSALFYAGWIVALGQHVHRHRRPFTTSMVQFGVTAVLMILAGLLMEQQSVEGYGVVWKEIVILGLFSTGAAFALQTFAQQYVRSSITAVLVSAESLFGAAAAFLILGERTPALGIAGAGLILVGIIIAGSGSETASQVVESDQERRPPAQGQAGTAVFRSIRGKRASGIVVPLSRRREVQRDRKAETVRGGCGNLNSRDEWIFRATAA